MSEVKPLAPNTPNPRKGTETQRRCQRRTHGRDSEYP